jgi:hypothetical protein
VAILHVSGISHVGLVLFNGACPRDFRGALGEFSEKKLGKSFAASVISSVIAPAKIENGCERTKLDERL